MPSDLPIIEIFQGISEQLSDVSLRRNRDTGARIVVLTFSTMEAIERFNSYTKRFNQSIRLSDSEGDISITPSSVQFIFGGPEGDDLQRVECKIEIDQEDHWERFMRFMHRYAEANGMEYGERGS
jgi:photosystem II Psb28-2 protein